MPSSLDSQPDCISREAQFDGDMLEPTMLDHVLQGLLSNAVQAQRNVRWNRMSGISS